MCILEGEKMRVKITIEAEQYIKENGRSVMIILGSMTGCCGGTAPMPQIELGVPKNLSGYEKNTIKDITVFIDKLIETDKQIDISLGKLLWFKKLSIEIT